MNIRNLLVAIGLLLVIGLGLLFFARRNGSKITISDITNRLRSTSTPVSEPQRELSFNLSELGESKESGTATIKESNKGVVVLLNLKGFPVGVNQPAHIHLGTCPNVGAVKYPLTLVTGGKSETELDVSLDDLVNQLPLAINVHKSEKESQVYFSCGDLPSK